MLTYLTEENKRLKAQNLELQKIVDKQANLLAEVDYRIIRIEERAAELAEKLAVALGAPSSSTKLNILDNQVE